MTTSGQFTKKQSAYESGRCETGEPLRPGGLELTARAISRCHLEAGARVLDIGCGSGVTARYLQQVLGFEVVGIDIAPGDCFAPPVSRAVNWYVQGNAASLPFASGTMDLVIAECSLSLMQDRNKVLSECFRVLRSKGRMAITDMYARRSEAVNALRGTPHTCAPEILVREELEEELRGAGFAIELWEDHSEALKPLLIRFLMEDGRMEQLWIKRGANIDDATKITKAMKDVRAGYFLLIAEKSDISTGGQES